MELEDALKKGRASLKEKIVSALLSKAVDTEDTTGLIFLSKRLNLFVSDAPRTTFKNTRIAMEALEGVIN